MYVKGKKKTSICHPTQGRWALSSIQFQFAKNLLISVTKIRETATQDAKTTQEFEQGNGPTA